MPRRLVFCIGLLVVLGAPQAVPSESKTETPPSQNSMLPPEAGVWVVELYTLAEPYTGGGQITSEGFAGGVSPLCHIQLSTTDLQSIAQAVSEAKPSVWKPRDVRPTDDQDRFLWSLTLHHLEPDGMARTYATSWFEGEEGLLPEDLAAIRATAVMIMDRLLKDCQSKVVPGH